MRRPGFGHMTKIMDDPRVALVVIATTGSKRLPQIQFENS